MRFKRQLESEKRLNSAHHNIDSIPQDNQYSMKVDPGVNLSDGIVNYAGSVPASDVTYDRSYIIPLSPIRNFKFYLLIYNQQLIIPLSLIVEDYKSDMEDMFSTNEFVWMTKCVGVNIGQNEVNQAFIYIFMLQVNSQRNLF